jgi:hypothetical protein
MSDFYGPLEKETGYWIAKHEDNTYCIKPLRLDVRASKLFIVAGGQLIQPPNEESKLTCDAESLKSLPRGHGGSGALGLIVLMPNGPNLGVVAINLYAPYGSWGLSPERDSVTFERIAPNGAYGWIAKWHEVHTGDDFESAEVYGVIGHSVELLTTITSYWTNAERAPSPPTEVSAKIVFDTHSNASSFYPLIMQVSGIYRGSPFRGNYRLVFDENSLTYLAPNNMPDEIKPEPFIALSEPGLLSLACRGTGYDRPVLMGIVVNFHTRTVQVGSNGLYHEKITGLDDAKVAFGEKEEFGFIGTIDRVTGDTQINAVNGNTPAYSLHCKPV